MNTSQLGSYAPGARRAFIAAVSAQAARLGITAKGNAPAEVQGDVLLVGGQAFPKAIAAARETLAKRVRAHDFEAFRYPVGPPHLLATNRELVAHRFGVAVERLNPSIGARRQN